MYSSTEVLQSQKLTMREIQALPVPIPKACFLEVGVTLGATATQKPEWRKAELLMFAATFYP